MFDTPDFVTQCFEDSLPPVVIETVIGSLDTLIGFAPQDLQPMVTALGEMPVADETYGGIRFGGVPQLPSAIEWPRMMPPKDPEAVATRGNEDAARMMRAHFEAGLPYAFVAQIELADMAAFDVAKGVLPETGRLLFFYDLVSGPWNDGQHTGQIIWDTTPADGLRHAEIPQDLLAAHQAGLAETAELNAEFGQETDPLAGTNYIFPLQRVQPVRKLDMISPWSLEFAQSGLPEAFAADPDGEFQYIYEEAAYECVPEPSEPVLAHRLLGSPVPVQDDPRYDAAAAEGGEPGDWTMLLQIDLADLTGDTYAEGTVYYLIRKTDLSERRFDRVFTVYQQT